MNNENDHDLLIKLQEKLESIERAINDIREDIKEQVKDHELRLRFMEKYVWFAFGVIGLIQFYFLYKQAFPGK